MTSRRSGRPITGRNKRSGDTEEGLKAIEEEEIMSEWLSLGEEVGRDDKDNDDDDTAVVPPTVDDVGMARGRADDDSFCSICSNLLIMFRDSAILVSR